MRPHVPETTTPFPPAGCSRSHPAAAASRARATTAGVPLILSLAAAAALSLSSPAASFRPAPSSSCKSSRRYGSRTRPVRPSCPSCLCPPSPFHPDSVYHRRIVRTVISLKKDGKNSKDSEDFGDDVMGGGDLDSAESYEEGAALAAELYEHVRLRDLQSKLLEAEERGDVFEKFGDGSTDGIRGGGDGKVEGDLYEERMRREQRKDRDDSWDWRRVAEEIRRQQLKRSRGDEQSGTRPQPLPPFAKRREVRGGKDVVPDGGSSAGFFSADGRDSVTVFSFPQQEGAGAGVQQRGEPYLDTTSSSSPEALLLRAALVVLALTWILAAGVAGAGVGAGAGAGAGAIGPGVGVVVGEQVSGGVVVDFSGASPVVREISLAASRAAAAAAAAAAEAPVLI